MKALINKEFKLATPMFAYMFITFTLMTFIPGYPILCGAFFMCFGLFQSYQYAREANDIVFSLLLPVRKGDVVRAKYIYAVAFQMVSMLFFVLFTLVRMTSLWDAQVYKQNVLMAANPVFLAFVLLIFTAFNTIFIGGFFKTAYKYGKPFVVFIVVNFVIIGFAEALHHFKGLHFLNEVRGPELRLQLWILAGAIVIYAIATYASCKKSEKRFNDLDL